MKQLPKATILAFQRRLFDFAESHDRLKPWEKERNPYKIWLFEVIMQQTRMAQGLPYYEKIIAQYPQVEDLAATSEDELFSLWKGLGYYSRARNLHHTAKYIVEECNGKFPDNYRDLMRLKGVGEYTAAAIASFAYKEDVAVLDGNVHRILSRIFGINKRIQSVGDKRYFQELAIVLLPIGKSDIYNQAMMDLGSQMCTPSNPQCERCSMSDICYAYTHQKTKELPPPKIRPILKDRYFYCLFVEYQGKIYLKKRTEDDIWKGLYEGVMQEGEDIEPEFWDAKGLDISQVRWSSWQKQTLSHQRIWMRMGRVLLKRKSMLLEDFEGFINLENVALPRIIDNWIEDQKYDIKNGKSAI